MNNQDIILSCFQAEDLIQAFRINKDKVLISLDLNLTSDEVSLSLNGVMFPNGQQVAWLDIKKVLKHKNRCYLVRNNKIQPIIIYSAKTNWVRALYPTQSSPTTLVSGMLMHRIKNTNPIEHIKSMVQTIQPLENTQVLDTATGLGYAAIIIAKQAKSVITVEVDPAAMKIARLNPWSKELFQNSNITQIIGDVLEEIKQFKDGEFDRIIHDPPTFKIAGELYSREFYGELFRVLKKGGKLFHYIGDPDSKHGNFVTGGAIKRLKEVGFYKVDKIPEAFGVLCVKN